MFLSFFLWAGLRWRNHRAGTVTLSESEDTFRNNIPTIFFLTDKANFILAMLHTSSKHKFPSCYVTCSHVTNYFIEIFQKKHVIYFENTGQLSLCNWSYLPTQDTTWSLCLPLCLSEMTAQKDSITGTKLHPTKLEQRVTWFSWADL